MVKTPCFQCKGAWVENLVREPHAVRCGQKKKKFILQDRKHHPDTVVVSSTSSEPHHKDAKSLGTTPSFSVSNFFLRVTGRVVSPFTHLGSFSFYTPFLHHLTILNSTLLLPNLTACKGDKILSFNYSPSSITST